MTKTYCAAPWRGLHINLDGDIRLCCAGQANMFGNVKHDSINCLTKSNLLQEIRSSVKKGILHETYCKNCTKVYGRGERQWFNEVHTDIDYNAIPIDLEHQIQSIDIRWNNTCNLACTYCSDFFSSTWAALNKQTQRVPLSRQYDDIIDQIAEHKEHLKTVMLVGGEPLLISQNQRLLESINRDVAVTVVSNLAVPLENNRIFNALKPRTNVNWNISFENIEQRFEFVRRAADWSMVSQNLDIIQDLSPQHTMGVAAIYHIFNCTHLIEFKQHCQNRNININWNKVQQTYLDPRYHDARIRYRALEHLEQLLKHPDLELSPTEQQFFQGIHHDLTQPLTIVSTARNELIYHLRKERTAFLALWPEFSEIFDEQ